MSQPKYEYPEPSHWLCDESRSADALASIAVSQRRLADASESIRDILQAFVFGKASVSTQPTNGKSQ